MNNAFTTYNFNIVGTFNLMKGKADRQMMLVDISGAREALDMGNAASEIFGFKHTLFYDDNNAVATSSDFNIRFSDTTDIFSPVMIALRDSNQMGTMVDFSKAAMAVIGGVFLIIVLSLIHI